jgi:CPA1 family monovalent cation:H+ antiporter
MLRTECNHFDATALAQVKPQADRCQECGLPGPIRACVTCGYVGCCESMNSHDTEHWKETGHPLIIRLPLDDASWVWCYEHQDYLR